MRFRSIACGRSFPAGPYLEVASAGNRRLGRHHAAGPAAAAGVAPRIARVAADSGRGQRGKVVVVSLGDGAVGVVVDATREILRVDPDIIEPAPALLTRGEGDAEITSICRLEAASGWSRCCRRTGFSGRNWFAAFLPNRRGGRNRTAIGSKCHGRRAVHHFSSGRSGLRNPDRCGQRDRAPARSHHAAAEGARFIDGVMNLRGSVVPIVDLRRRFDLSATEHAGSQRILMVAIGASSRVSSSTAYPKIMKVPDRCDPAGARIVGGSDAADLPGYQSGSQGANGAAGRSRAIA